MVILITKNNRRPHGEKAIPHKSRLEKRRNTQKRFSREEKRSNDDIPTSQQAFTTTPMKLLLYNDMALWLVGRA